MSLLRRRPRLLVTVIILSCYLPALFLSLLFVHLLNTLAPMPLPYVLFLSFFIVAITGLMATFSLLEVRTRTH